MPDVAANLREVESRIAAACVRAGRKRQDILLIAVTKTFPASAVDEAIAAGVTDVGENRVQEAREKQPLVRGTARWHLIGHLQSNKAKDAVHHFGTIHSIDSLALAEKVARAAEAAGKRIDVLLQVNIGGETQKSGIDRAEAEAAARAIAKMDPLSLRGLMCIPPAGGPEETRPYFRELRALRDGLGLDDLSMGMSGDYEVAIEEGATMVRVGSAIFGSRT